MNTRTAISRLERAAELPADDKSIRGSALLALVWNLNIALRINECRQLLVRCLNDSSGELRASAAKTWCELFSEDDQLVRFLIATHGLRGRRKFDLLELSAEIAITQGWHSVALARAADVDAEAPQKDSGALTLGRACHHAKLVSLAYRAYARASEVGVDVAKANMALLVGHNPTPAAAHAILESHKGNISSAKPTKTTKKTTKNIKSVHSEEERKIS